LEVNVNENIIRESEGKEAARLDAKATSKQARSKTRNRHDKNSSDGRVRRRRSTAGRSQDEVSIHDRVQESREVEGYIRCTSPSGKTLYVSTTTGSSKNES